MEKRAPCLRNISRVLRYMLLRTYERPLVLIVLGAHNNLKPLVLIAKQQTQNKDNTLELIVYYGDS